MKKILSIVMLFVLALSVVACGETANDINVKSEGVMTYADFAAAALETEVTIETVVQAKQSWWEKDGVGVGTFYTQDGDGAYFLYEMPCSKEDFDKMVPGTKIKVKGFKAEWAGEVEIIDATYEIIEGQTYIAEAIDLTDKLGTEELINFQNQKALFKGMTVVSLSYKDSEWDKDIYLTVSYNGAEYSFCVENYLNGPDTDVYKAVAALQAGDVIDVEGFAYWYEGINTHITAITKK